MASVGYHEPLSSLGPQTVDFCRPIERRDSVFEHLRTVLGGPVVWAPAMDDAVVLSRRGGDFRIVSGAGFAVRNVGAEAAIALRYPERSGASA